MRIPKTSEVISISLGLTLALLISVGAAAQSTPPPVSSTQPDATAPAPSAPPAAQQPSSTPPSANSSSSGSAQSSSASIDDELQLTPDQKQKIAAVVDDENKQISAVRDDNSMSLEQKQQKVLTIRQAGTPKIKAVLTPDQLQKLAAIQQRMRDQQGQQQGSPQPPAQNSTPPHQ
jgi:Spy/CpxP family protein refolding chaperone